MKEGQGDFAVLDLSTVGEQFSKFLSNNLVCDCDHEEDEAHVSDLIKLSDLLRKTTCGFCKFFKCFIKDRSFIINLQLVSTILGFVLFGYGLVDGLND